MDMKKVFWVGTLFFLLLVLLSACQVSNDEQPSKESGKVLSDIQSQDKKPQKESGEYLDDIQVEDKQPPKGSEKFFDNLRRRNASYGWKDIHPEVIPWEYHRMTKNKNPLMFAQFGKSSGDCILFLGGVHGDELPSVYLMFKLAQYLHEHPEVVEKKCIVIAPLVNPDGYLKPTPTRVNANGVDINRNFPTKRWNVDAYKEWKARSKKNRRYHPGPSAGSERETLFQVALIKRFKPQKILSVHSPLNFFDYDGPSADLDSFEKWMEKMCKEANHPLKKYGYYPGSLGNYAGQERNIFTLTLELSTSDPKKGIEYFKKFQPAFLKFINLPVTGTPPYTRLVESAKLNPSQQEVSK